MSDQNTDNELLESLASKSGNTNSHGGAGGAAGRSPATSRVAGRSETTIVFNVADADSATRLAGAIGNSGALSGGAQKSAPEPGESAGAEPSRDATASSDNSIDAAFSSAVTPWLDAPAQKLDDKLRSGGGSPLPSDVADDAKGSYGVDMGDVRVHDDSTANELAADHGLKGFSYGSDVFFGGGEYQPDTEDGRFVLMHELAHVAQTDGKRAGGVHGKLEKGSSSSPLELDADRAAEAALEGQTYQVQSAPLALRGFGATAKKTKSGKRDKTTVCHENQTLNAADGKFSAADAKEIYSGNWQRDMNQMLIPKLKPVAPQIFELMDIAHIQHFGKAMEGGSKEFGTYDPVEHIDNPGGLTGDAIFDQDGDSAHSNKVSGKDDEALADTYKKRHGELKEKVDELKTAKEGEDKAEDARKDGTKLKTTPKPGEAVNKGDKEAFGVDESGIPLYMQTSRMALVKGLAGGVRLRHQPAKTKETAQANKRRALRMAGEALHIMQDYYAHSNFCEVALNIALESKVDDEGKIVRDEKGNAVKAGKEDRSAMKATIESLRGKVDDAALDKAGKHKINSYVHKISKDKDGKKKVDSKNMSIKGADGRQREVMATGTFNLQDTAHSLKEKVTGAVKEIDPFEEGGGGGIGKAVVQWAENKVGPGGVSEVGTILKAAMPVIDGILSGAGTVQEVGGRLSGGVEKGVGKAKSLLHKGKGVFDDLTGGDSSDDRKAAADAEAKGNARGDAKIEEGKKQKRICKQISTQLDAIATKLTGGAGLVELYEFSKSTAERASLTRLAKQIPVVGDKVAAVVKKQIDAARKWAKKHLQGRWRKARDQALAEFTAAVATLLGTTEVKDGSGSNTMTQPTHTDIAKDFDDDQHGTEDHDSVIEEAHEWLKKATWKDLWGPLTGDDVIEDVKKKKRELDERDEKEKMPGEDDPHKHQHRHGGAWLAGIGNSLATSASKAILTDYSAAMNGTAAGVPQYIANLESTVNQFFCHPADCQGLWLGQMQTAIDSSNASTEELRKEIARRSAQPPSAQAPNIHQTADGDDHSEKTKDLHDYPDHEHGDGDHEHGDHEHGDHEHGDHKHEAA